MKILLVCVLFAVFFISLTYAYCLVREIKQLNHKWSTNKTSYLEHFGKKYGIESHLVDLSECLSCICKKERCNCCRIDFFVGVVDDRDCSIAGDGCESAIFNLEKTILCGN